MTYLVLHVDWTAGRCNTWHEVWSGVHIEGATHAARHFSLLNALPTIVVQMRSTAPDRAVPVVIGGFDAIGSEWVAEVPE